MLLVINPPGRGKILGKSNLIFASHRDITAQGVRRSLSKVIDSLAAGYPSSIVHLLEFENRRRILFK